MARGKLNVPSCSQCKQQMTLHCLRGAAGQSWCGWFRCRNCRIASFGGREIPDHIEVLDTLND